MASSLRPCAAILAGLAIACGGGSSEVPTSTEPDAAVGDPLVVETAEGPVRGEADGALRVFRGIPYAAPPVGSLRFRPPRPAPPREGILDATAFGERCPQLRVVTSTRDVVGDEDCLTLNVWAHADAAARPVMVFIHGGAFQQGSGSLPLYDGRALAAAGDVVVVTINYRLGALGLLATEALAAESGEDSAGNYAIRDQIAALAWLQRNLAGFGGDPDNLTIFGESAGGASVCALIGSPLADSLFGRAIVQSGGCHPLPGLRTATSAQPSAMARGAEIVAAAGCQGADDELTCLRALPADQLVRAGASGTMSGLGVPEYSPSLDGVVLTDQTFELLDRGERDLPLLIGSNADEATLFTLGTVILTRAGFEARVRAAVGDALADAVSALYPEPDYPRPKDAWNALFGEARFVCPATATAAAAAGGASPAFAYHFERIPGPPLDVLGASHGIELRYLFGTYEVEFSDDIGGFEPAPADLAIGAAMQAAWTSFARTGLPAAEPTWPRFDPAAPALFILDDPLRSRDDVSNGRCAALQQLGIVPRPDGA